MKKNINDFEKVKQSNNKQTNTLDMIIFLKQIIKFCENKIKELENEKNN